MNLRDYAMVFSVQFYNKEGVLILDGQIHTYVCLTTGIKEASKLITERMVEYLRTDIEKYTEATPVLNDQEANSPLRVKITRLKMKSRPSMINIRPMFSSPAVTIQVS